MYVIKALSFIFGTSLIVGAIALDFLLPHTAASSAAIELWSGRIITATLAGIVLLVLWQVARLIERRN